MKALTQNRQPLLTGGGLIDGEGESFSDMMTGSGC